MVNEVALNFLGTSFNITTDADEAYLEKVLSQFHAAIDKTQNISGINEPLNVAVLTGFMLCDEINKTKKQLEELKETGEAEKNDMSLSVSWEEQEVEERTQRMITKLEQALKIFGDDKYL